MTAIAPVPSRRLLVVRNPIAGRRHRNRTEEIVAELCRLGAVVDLRDTSARGDAEAFAFGADAGRYDVVVAAGGDGTINEVVNGLMRRPGDDLALGIIPLGTANVLGREIGIVPSANGRIARTLFAGAPTEVTVGEIRTAGGELRHFLLMVGAGFDAHVVAGVDPILKRRLGKAAYVWRSLVELARYRPRRYRVSFDGQTVDLASVIASNGRLYAGPYVVAAKADLRHPHLSMCQFDSAGRWHVLRYGAALVRGALPASQGYRVVEARRLRIEAGPQGGREPVQVDGDNAFELPIEIGIAPRRLRLLMPTVE